MHFDLLLSHEHYIDDLQLEACYNNIISEIIFDDTIIVD
jgi:hypothetical protein